MSTPIGVDTGGADRAGDEAHGTARRFDGIDGDFRASIQAVQQAAGEPAVSAGAAELGEALIGSISVLRDRLLAVAAGAGRGAEAARATDAEVAARVAGAVARTEAGVRGRVRPE